MDFGFDDNQESFRDATRKYLASAFSAAELRQVWEDGQDYDHRVWKDLTGLGIAGVLVDEEYGGSGGSPVDLTLVLEELGASAVPEPVVETAVIAPLLLQRFADEQTKRRWLPSIAEGDLLVAVATGRDGVLVADGRDAGLVIVLDGDDVHLVDADQVTSRAVPGADPSRRLVECDISTSAQTLLTRDPAAGAWLHLAGAAATASLLVGLSQHLLDLTRDHVLSRRQFGKPLAEFQSLKHRLADVALQTEAARSLAWHAMYRLSTQDDQTELAARMAKSAASRAAYVAGAASFQLHGGIGFTWEHDLHFWLQRGKAWERAFGCSEAHRELVGARVLELA